MSALPFRILGINHVGLAPKSAQSSADFFDSILQLNAIGTEDVVEQKTRTTLLESAHHPNTTRLEILEDLAHGEGPVGKFLAKKGSGIHHLALTVDDIDAALKYLTENNIRLIDSAPRHGTHETRVAFIHPEATGGLLIELVEEKH